MTPIDRFNSLFEKKELKWKRLFLFSLPTSTQRYVELVQRAGVQLEQATQQYEGVYLFRLIDPFYFAHYLVHNSKIDAHIWADEFFNNLDPSRMGDFLAREAVNRDQPEIRKFYRS